MALSISQQQNDLKSRISSLKVYKEISTAEKSILSKAGDSTTKVGEFASTQLNKAKEFQKRYLKDAPTSMDRILDLLGLTQGSGLESVRLLRKTMIQTLVKIGPEINKILQEETIKALGCSQEQTYAGINVGNLQIKSLRQLPISQGIYVPLTNIDLIGSLKIPSPEENPNQGPLTVGNILSNPLQDTIGNWLGKIYYEKEIPSTSDKFIPYGGKIRFPMLKTLRARTISGDQTYENNYGAYYNGKSGNKLFDMVYSSNNEFGESGDFIRVFLLDRENSPLNSSGTPMNNVTEFVTDYFRTIEPYSLPQVVATMVNYLTNAVSIKARVGVGQLESDSKFTLLLNRILGLCFDEREEIDVSGISKIGELDGVDESFFEFTDVDLRNIELEIANVQEGVVTFVDCDNVKLPVNPDLLINEIINFADTISAKTQDEKVQSIENIIDSITNNQSWNILYPNSVGLELAVNRNFIKKLPVALASSILNPKVLLPIMTMFKVIEKDVKEDVNDIIKQQNDLIKSANTILESGTTIGQQVSPTVNSSVDFVRKNRTFVIGLVSRISALFIKTLFEVLKKDIFNLLEVVIKDIYNSKIAKEYLIITRLVELTYIVARFTADYRKCKSLLDEIALLLKMVYSVITNAGTKPFTIPPFLNLLSSLLPGFSPERALLNAIEQLERLGVPTGPMPDGSPNVMNFFAKSVMSGMDKEEAQNGKVETTIVLPPPFGALTTVGKKL